MRIEDAAVLLTGNSGRLGCRVQARLRTLGVKRIVGLDKKEKSDLLDAHSVAAACTRCNVTVHLAGLAHPGVGTARSYLWNNAIGTLVLLEEALQAGHERFVFVSSGAVYGWDIQPRPDVTIPVDESQQVVWWAAEPYTASKIIAEHFLRVYGAEGHIQVFILRLAPIWNPDDEPNEMFFRAALSPSSAVDAVVNCLQIETPDSVTIYNVADIHRQGDFSIDRAVRDGIIC